MKFELEEPYKSLYKAGYLVTNSENRRNVVLTKLSGGNTTTSYARYLMGVKLGHIVDKNYEVDHIDNDKTNDSLDNLQLLSRRDNIAKNNSLRIPKTMLRHGTLSCYRYCKCELCKSAYRAWQRAYKRRRRGSRLPRDGT